MDAPCSFQSRRFGYFLGISEIVYIAEALNGADSSVVPPPAVQIHKDLCYMNRPLIVLCYSYPYTD